MMMAMMMTHIIKMCQDSSVSRVTRLWDVRSRFDSRWGKIFSSKSLPDRIPESLIRLLIIGVFNVGINRKGRVGNYSPPPSPKTKKYVVIRAHHIILRVMVINSASIFMKRIN